MQIIIISSNKSAHKHWQLSLKSFLLFTGAFIAVLVTIMMAIETKANIPTTHSPSELALTSSNDDNTSAQDSEVILQEYYVQRLGQLQAESIRLKALTERIAKMVGVDTEVFVLNEQPGQGGYNLGGNSISLADFKQELTSVENNFESQNKSLAVLQSLYIVNETIQSAIPRGSPSAEGWVSSNYGKRIDPFNGKKAFHHGIDIAGRQGSPILAAADGIITWTGRRSGYGRLVEIDHGNGYVTRYAHNEELIAKTGDRVKKGQEIALMGSTGRSTGPHVHYEVLLDGKTINPYSFVKG